MVLQILGASAALATFVVFIGGVMMWLRFDAIDLPADRAVALLPRSDLLATGAHSLAAPILIGLVVVLVVFLIEPLNDEDKPTIQLYVAIGLLFVIASIVAFLNVKGLDLVPYGMLMYLALAAGAGVVLWTAHRTRGFRPLGWTLFASFALLGGLLAVVTTAGSPKLEPVAIVFKSTTASGSLRASRIQGISGFLVAETSDKLYLAPLPGSGDLADPFADADLDRIVEIPRDSILRLAVRAPAGVHPDESGREQAQSLFQDLRVQLATGKPAKALPVMTDDPVETFAPLVNLHSHESAWPMNVSTFLAHAALIWAHPGACPDYVAALRRHIADPAGATQAYGKIDPAKLGAGGYSHYASDPSRRDLTSLALLPPPSTLPSDADSRPAGLPLDQGLTRISPTAHGQASIASSKRALRTSSPASTPITRPTPIRSAERMQSGSPRRPRWTERAAGTERCDLRVRRRGRPGSGSASSISVARPPTRWTPISARYHFHDQSRDVPWTAVRTVAGPGAGDPPAR